MNAVLDLYINGMFSGCFAAPEDIMRKHGISYRQMRMLLLDKVVYKYDSNEQIDKRYSVEFSDRFLDALKIDLFVDDNPDGIRIVDIANMLGVTQQAISQLLLNANKKLNHSVLLEYVKTHRAAIDKKFT